MNDQVWPVVDYSTHRWMSGTNGVDPLWSKRCRQRNTGNFHQAIVPVIAGRQVSLDGELAIEASRVAEDITRFDEQYRGGAPFAAALLRSESAASSQIENLTANVRRISLAVLGDTSRPNATLIARNTAALQGPSSSRSSWTFQQSCPCTTP